MTDFQADELIYIWGYSADEIEYLKAFHKDRDFPPPAPIFEEQLGLTITDIFEGRNGPTPAKQPPVRVILLPKKSTDTGIRAYVTAFKEAGLPRPIFAAVTDTNEAWTFNELVDHLIEEQTAAMKKMKEKTTEEEKKW
ncbi:MAG: DUF3783 domain-containing protein [Pseudomonadota bacterium]